MMPWITGAGAARGYLMEKQRLVPAVEEWWNAWEIHCLILVSLFLQVFLFLFAGRRQRSSRWLLHTGLWLAYLSADSVAFYVLGHLAVRASEPGHQLVSFWAPFLLVHLGGQETITALSKQDNELWLRHLLNLVMQVAVAGYVVIKAPWSNIRLRAAMVLMFLSGCYKYGERTITLYSADPVQLRLWATDMFSSRLQGKQFRRGRPGLSKREETRDEALKTMSETLSMMSKGRSSESSRELYWDAVILTADIICVDVPLNQVHTITAAAEAGDLLAVDMLQGFMSRQDRHNAYDHVGAILDYCYRRLYTKVPVRQALMASFDDTDVSARIAEAILRIMLLGTFLPLVATIIALALFISAEKDHQLHATGADVTVSYLLLVGAIVLDVCSVTMFALSQMRLYIHTRILPLGNANRVLQSAGCMKQWSEQLGQYNMISTAGMILGTLFGCDVKRTPVCRQDDQHASVSEFILDSLLASGTRRRWDIASTRGQVALDKWTATRFEAVEETLRVDDFPTSILIWHLATDMCYHYSSSGTTHNSDEQVETQHRLPHKQMISRDISNYIMYLIFKCGVMITTKSQLVHDSARREIVKVLAQPPWANIGHRDAAMMLLEKGCVLIEHPKSEEEQESTQNEIQIDRQPQVANNDYNAADNHMKKLKQSTQTLKSPVLPRACAVAKELISIEDETARWDFIAEVWAELLFYTTPRCGGGFHYDGLSKGGEFATHVLVLMYYLGPFLPPPDASAP